MIIRVTYKSMPDPAPPEMIISRKLAREDQVVSNSRVGKKSIPPVFQWAVCARHRGRMVAYLFIFAI